MSEEVLTDIYPSYIKFKYHIYEDIDVDIVFDKDTQMVNLSRFIQTYKPNASFSEFVRIFSNLIVMNMISWSFYGKPGVSINGMEVNEEMRTTLKQVFDSKNRVRSSLIDFTNNLLIDERLRLPNEIKGVYISFHLFPCVMNWLDYKYIVASTRFETFIHAAYLNKTNVNIDVSKTIEQNIRDFVVPEKSIVRMDLIKESLSRSITEPSIKIKGKIGEESVYKILQSKFSDIQDTSSRKHQMDFYIPSKDIRIEVKNERKISATDYDRFNENIVKLEPKLSIFISCDAEIETKMYLNPNVIYCNFRDLDGKVGDFIFNIMNDLDTHVVKTLSDKSTKFMSNFITKNEDKLISEFSKIIEKAIQNLK